MDRILVTGSPGWLGNTLVKQLLLQHSEIRCFVHPVFRENAKSLLPESDDLDIFFGDLRDARAVRLAMKNISIVFHCAGLQHPERTSEIYQVNAEATKIIANLSGD